MQMEYPNKELAQLVIEYCITYDITHVVISPGSRNAPFTIGFSNHPEIKTYSIVDERSAAFFALGIAQQTQKPVVIVCTSGSALLNFYPAIAEAFYSNIPLVVISADRPKHLIDVGDGQTIRQENVFENHSLFNANLDTSMPLTGANELVENALLSCIRDKGPVHINVPFDEPLYETTSVRMVNPIKKETIQLESNELDIIPLSTIWNSAKKKMILVGESFPDSKMQEVLSQFVNDESVLILTETHSNLHHDKFINSIDSLIFKFNKSEMEAIRPEVLITFGGMVVSKKIKQLLRNFPPKEHWHVGLKNAPNTYHALTQHLRISPREFFKKLLKNATKIKSSYQLDWLAVKLKREEKHTKNLSKIPYSDFKVFDGLLKSLPEGTHLQLGNSSIIRYSQLFKLKKSFRVFCNRGTSGIDGSTSTAIGAALTRQEQTVFITGDVSFFYDSNALWNNYIKNDFRIIILNNGGGGIFRIIPGPQNSKALDFFETPHKLNASYLCNMFDFEYLNATNESTLEKALDTFYKSSVKPKLLEIFTPKNENAAILRNYFETIK